MYNIIADTHTHTLASGHAYSTVTENAAAAALRGLKFMALTDHTPGLVGAPIEFYFRNFKAIPRYLSGVMIIKGAELNIMDYKGTIDLTETTLRQLEWIIASLHPMTLEPGTVEEHTGVWMEIANNPYVDVIGHCGAGKYPFEHRPVIQEFARTGKIVEINSASFTVRSGSRENCREIAKLCAEYGVQIVVSSDAHFHALVGEFTDALAMLEDIRFPEELILNADYDRFLHFLQKRTGKLLTDEA